MATGDAVVCGKCRAILSSHDSLVKELGDVKMDDEDDSIVGGAAQRAQVDGDDVGVHLQSVDVPG